VSTNRCRHSLLVQGGWHWQRNCIYARGVYSKIRSQQQLARISCVPA
jgi:hypothetical protein